jgi:chemotaxis protein MotB
VSAGRARGRRGRQATHGGGGHNGPDERWLLTYADMITLLMALFIVLWSMSTTDATKLKALSESLHSAFGPKLLPGGGTIESPAPAATPGARDTSEEPPIPSPASIAPAAPSRPTNAGERAAEDDEFRRIKASIDAYAKAHGLSDKLQARIVRRGLVVRLMTDDVLFASGEAALEPEAEPLLRHIAAAVGSAAIERPLLVEGHTDDVPVSGTYASNWELSATRATSVVRFLIAAGLPPARLGAAGYAATHPAASNATEAGRARNRRVEIVLLRQEDGATDQGVSP